MKTFKQKIVAFWQWFAQHEAELDHLTQADDQTRVYHLLNSALSQAIPGIAFAMPASYTVNLCPGYQRERYFLTTCLVENMPQQLSAKWHFHPWQQASFEKYTAMQNETLGEQEIMVEAEPIDDGHGFALNFYHPAFDSMAQQDAYHVFYKLLEVALGENIVIGHVEDVDMMAYAKAGMVELSKLGDHIKSLLAAEDKELLLNPCESLVAYALQPDEEGEPRSDIMSGITLLPDLLNEFYAGEESDIYDYLQYMGVKAGFLAYAHNSQPDLDESLVLRYEIALRLQWEVLNQGAGTVLGQALGENNAYIDLLLYDEHEFLQNAGRVLAEYGYQFEFYSFRQGSAGQTLSW